MHDLADVPGRRAGLLQRRLGGRMELRVGYSANGPAPGDTVLLESAILNRAAEARDAMPGRDTLRTIEVGETRSNS